MFGALDELECDSSGASVSQEGRVQLPVKGGFDEWSVVGIRMAQRVSFPDAFAITNVMRVSTPRRPLR
jgi:hypothetical protein